jgi:hypothetical protein
MESTPKRVAFLGRMGLRRRGLHPIARWTLDKTAATLELGSTRNRMPS